jgi:mycofactocin precursor peptide peptidase
VTFSYQTPLHVERASVRCPDTVVALLLEDLTWTEVAPDKPHSTLLVPVGSTEQHGPHLPYSTDTDIAVALAVSAAADQDDVFVAPAIPYGSSGEHQAFPGTLSIGRQAVEHLLVELARSAAHTFKRCIFVSTHGGNEQPVARAVSRLLREEHRVVAWCPRWEGDAHAGHIETSVMLALCPERVEFSRAVPGNKVPIGELMPFLRRRGIRDASPTGILGDPTKASAEEGRRLLEVAAHELRSRISDA